MIRFACPGCRATYTVADEKAGKTGRCQKCQGEFVIPGDATPVGDAEAGPVEIAPCPGCQARLSVAAADFGTNVECPYCQAVYPATAAAAPGGPDWGAEVPRTRPALVPAADRPSRRRRYDEDDDRPSRRRRRDDEDDYDRPSRRWSARRRAGIAPPSVTAIAGMLLGGAIYGIVHFLAVGGSTGFVCCLWPGGWYELVWAVLAIVRAAAMLGGEDPDDPPNTLLVMQIITIVNLDVINCVLGIVGLVLSNTDDVQDYYSRPGRG